MANEALGTENTKTMRMPHSKYQFQYPENKEYMYRVMRHGTEDITDTVMNNVTLDLFLEVLRLREILDVWGIPYEKEQGLEETKAIRESMLEEMARERKDR